MCASSVFAFSLLETDTLVEYGSYNTINVEKNSCNPGSGAVRMDVYDKIKQAEVLARYPLGWVFRMSPTDSPDTSLAKILSPPVTLPEELDQIIIRTLEEESREIQNSDEDIILSPTEMESYPGAIIVRFPNPELTSLSRYVRDNHPLPGDRIMKILDQLAYIFSCFFELGIHRFQLDPDIFPINPGDGKLAYMDTGLVNLAKFPEVISFGYLDGKPQFLPPELLCCDDLGAASEVYVFAMLACYLLSGKLPCEHLSLVAAAAENLAVGLPVIEYFGDDRDDSLNLLLSRASVRNPSKRLSPLPEFLGKLRNLLENET